MYTLRDLDTDLFSMFMNKVEIMDKVVDELNEGLEYYQEAYDNDWFDMIHAACDNLGYDFNDLSDADVKEIYRRVVD